MNDPLLAINSVYVLATIAGIAFMAVLIYEKVNKKPLRTTK